MSKTVKTALWVVIAIIVVGGIWWWSASRNGSPAPAATQTPPTAPPAQPTAQAPAPAGGASDSNAALQSDLSQIDGQMNGMTSDTANIDQGLNDQPVEQSQLQ